MLSYIVTQLVLLLFFHNLNCIDIFFRVMHIVMLFHSFSDQLFTLNYICAPPANIRMDILSTKIFSNFITNCLFPGIDGGWSDWSSWSSCSPECFHHRRRTCTNPGPSTGGKYCLGLDLETRNCSNGFCQGKTLNHF